MNIPLAPAIAIVTACIAVIAGLITLYLKLTKSMADCKVDCERQFVNSELFLRETGFQRRALEKLSASVNRLEGNLKVVDKLPQISGEIARQVVREMKNGEKNES